MLRLLHVSDIHFSGRLRDMPSTDVELSVRDRMLADFGRIAAENGLVDAILVVGDIANRGKPDEYSLAASFLGAAASLIGCAPHQVICVPGNHDVDRSAHGLTHQALLSQIRSAEPPAASDKLLDLLREPEAGQILLRPFSAYNSFALAYGCDFGPGKLSFPPKQFDLGDKTTVEVFGINTAWTCDGSESADTIEQRLVAGIFQAVKIASRPDTVSVTLSHHPPAWLRDAEQLKEWTACAQIVLTGHEHSSGIKLSADERTLYVASGAVNPSRDEEGWIPAYNLIEIDEPDRETNRLAVRVYPRRWQNGEHAEFGPDRSEQYPRSFKIHWQPAAPVDTVRSEPAPNADIAPPPEEIASSHHAHVFAVMSSPPDLRRSIAREMGLLHVNTQSGLADDRELILAAHQRDQLAELAARILGGRNE